MNRTLVWICLISIACVGLLLPSNAEKVEHPKIDGKQIFEQHCASCHTGGGNRLQSHHPIAGSKQLVTLATFKNYLSAPPGHMPYYQDIVGNKKILDALYNYCKQLKKEPTEQAFLNKNELADIVQ